MVAMVNNTAMNIGVHVSFQISVFVLFRYTQQCNCWVIWQFYFYFFEKPLYYFPQWLTNFVFVVQLLSCVCLFVTPWTAVRQASLSFTISWSLLKLVSIDLMLPSNHLILCHPILLSLIFPSIRVSV